jgi:DNA-binding CsgD family transcriptional regulator
MSASSPPVNYSLSSAPKSLQPQLSHDQREKIGHRLLELHFGSVMLLDSQHRVIYASRDVCSLFQEAEPTVSESMTPPEITKIAQILKQCREQFAHQSWALDFNIVTEAAISLRIRSRWLQLTDLAEPCILLIVEDRQQFMQEVALNTAQAWGLTPREQEVWMLHQSGYTHSKIAEKLKISKNTVKKHMSSIHGKRRAGDFT